MRMKEEKKKVEVEETLEEEKKEEAEDAKKCSCEDKKECKKHKKNKYKEKISELEKQVGELTEKVKYSQAELINYRKRKDDEIANFKKYCNQDIILDLIEIVDNFERAINLDDENLSDELSKFLSGFKMMYARLVEILKSYGVEEISRVGEVFDPNLEQALMTDSVPEMDDDVVIDVMLKGYKLKDRVIRPASVKINKKKEGDDNNE